MTLADTREEMAEEEIERLIKQKDRAYSERNKLVASLAVILKSAGFNVYLTKHLEPDWEDNWRNILVMELCGRQITWHFHDGELHLLDKIEWSSHYIYDGHTTEKKYQRLLEFANNFEIINWHFGEKAFVSSEG